MEPEKAIDTAVQASGKTAGMIADYGMLVMVGVLFLACGAVALWLIARYYNRKISGDYIHKDEVEEWVKNNAKHLIKLDVSHLPDLRNHKLFTSTTKSMRQAETIRLENKVATKMARDLIVWSLRAHRDIFHDLINDAYEAKEGFDAFLGDQDKIRSKIEETYTNLNAAVKCRLVEDFGFSEEIFDEWQASREESDRLMMEVLELSLDRPDPYWKIRAVLDSVFARCYMLRMNVLAFFQKHPLQGIEYNPPEEASENTMSGLRGKVSKGYPAILFDKPRKSFNS